jgi:multisubunit Na+/H+ antiporter MnhB subunit
MAQVRNVRPGYAVIHPNRQKVICKVTKLIVVAILLATVAIVLILTFGGWSKLEGMKPVNFASCLIFLLLAFGIMRWAAGLLPIAAGLGILLLIVAVVAALGLAGTTWAARNHHGFAVAQSLFGGTGLSNSILALFTDLLIPVEVALIAVAMFAFSQGWNVETEVPEEEARKRGAKPVATGPSTATA